MEALLCKAISDGLVIEFLYDGQNRVVEPFTLGIHKTTGNLVLSAYRVGGYTKSGNEPPWRLYTVKDISSLRITDQPSADTREFYNPNDSRLSTIICTK